MRSLYGKPVIFSIVSNANYRLGAIKQSLFGRGYLEDQGTYANGNTSLHVHDSNLMVAIAILCVRLQGYGEVRG